MTEKRYREDKENRENDRLVEKKAQGDKEREAERGGGGMAQ